MQVIRETLWKRCLSTPTKPLAKNSNICLSETAYQHKGTRKKCKKTNQAAIILGQLQCLMDKPHRKLWPKSKTSYISKQSPRTLHHTFLLGRSRFTAQLLSALGFIDWVLYAPVNVMPAEGGGRAWGGDLTFFKNLQSNSLPTGKSFQSNATKFPHPRLHIAVHPKAEPKKGTIKISPSKTLQSFINVAASAKIHVPVTAAIIRFNHNPCYTA